MAGQNTAAASPEGLNSHLRLSWPENGPRFQILGREITRRRPSMRRFHRKSRTTDAKNTHSWTRARPLADCNWRFLSVICAAMMMPCGRAGFELESNRKGGSNGGSSLVWEDPPMQVVLGRRWRQSGSADAPPGSVPHGSQGGRRCFHGVRLTFVYARLEFDQEVACYL